MKMIINYNMGAEKESYENDRYCMLVLQARQTIGPYDQQWLAWSKKSSKLFLTKFKLKKEMNF